MLVRIRGTKSWLSDERVRELSFELSSSIGHDQFLILRTGEGFTTRDESKPRRALTIIEPFVDEYEDSPEHVGRVVYLQDGPAIVAEADEQFIDVNLMGRYYGKGYERGHWPNLRAIICWLSARIPQGEVWYGGDSSGCCAEHMTPDRIADLDAHWFANGRRPYTRHASSFRANGRGFAGTEAPICPTCDVSMFECGGSRDFDFWCCDGCGEKATKHTDGRIAWAETTRHHDFPVWLADGSVQQRKDDH